MLILLFWKLSKLFRIEQFFKFSMSQMKIVETFIANITVSFNKNTMFLLNF